MMMYVNVVVEVVDFVLGDASAVDVSLFESLRVLYYSSKSNKISK